MKTSSATAILALALSVSLSPGRSDAEETLLGDLKDIEHDGYGGPSVRFTQINGDFAVLTGGQGGWIINHRFVLGGGGFGLANAGTVSESDATTGPIEGKLEMGYGGGMVGLIIKSDALVHATVDVLIGAGGMSTQNHVRDDVFFVTEPAAHIVLNIASFCCLATGVSYRFTEGADFGGLGDADLDGPSWGILIKFGSF